MDAPNTGGARPILVPSTVVSHVSGRSASGLGITPADQAHPFDGRQRLYKLSEVEQRLAGRDPAAHAALTELHPPGARYVAAARVEPELRDRTALRAAARDATRGVAFRPNVAGDAVDAVMAKPTVVRDAHLGAAAAQEADAAGGAARTGAALLKSKPVLIAASAAATAAVAIGAVGLVRHLTGGEKEATGTGAPAEASEPDGEASETPPPEETPAPAPEPAADAGRRERIAAGVQQAVAESGVAADTSVVVRDSADDSVIASHQADRAVEPASVQKSLTAAAALSAFGPDHRFQTRVVGAGEVRDGTLHGDLWIVGGGDPRLGNGHLDEIAAKVKAAGITNVTGRVMVDDSLFDAERGVPGWAPDATEYALPIGALLLCDRKEFGPESGGSENPGVYAGNGFKAALDRSGIAVGGDIGTGVAPGDAKELATHDSAPLADLVTHMNHVSSNTTAEILTKHLGVHHSGQGTTAAGVQGAQAELAKLGVPMDGINMHDGSGLNLDNELSGAAVTAMFEAALADPKIGPVLLESLPKGGEPNTSLAASFKGPGDRVMAKPGGLNRTTSIAGVALGGEDRHRYTFAVISSNSEQGLDIAAGNRLQERIAQIIAEN